MKNLKDIFNSRGAHRTKGDYFRNAILLSFVAGIVNISGFLAISRLTTNVTGHFAMFINELNNSNYWAGINFLIYILFFFLGAFTSGMILGYYKKIKNINVYVMPVILEILIILAAMLMKIHQRIPHPNLVADLLLFAMGMQNAYVTHISKAVVRTTHLTGLFTDLGIEMADMVVRRKNKERKRISQQVKIHFNIIIFFFLGGIIGGLGYTVFRFQIKVLWIAIFTLVFYLFYDLFAIYWRRFKNYFD